MKEVRGVQDELGRLKVEEQKLIQQMALLTQQAGNAAELEE